jgi:hypothetical protein
LDVLLPAYRDLPQTLNYDDFALENLAVSRDVPFRALLFDYGQLCIGPAASDWRNVVSGLRGKARQGFIKRYGQPDERERVLDDPLSILYALLVASRREHLPAWAEILVQWVRDGTLEKRVRAALELALE